MGKFKVISRVDNGVILFEPTVFGDSRGYFMESYNRAELSEIGINCDFIQDNESMSTYGVVRGLHYQAMPYTQAKLVRVISGRVLDAAVDIRKDSSNFGKVFYAELSGENHRQFYIPRGFAHGFSVLEGDAIVEYKCDNYYAPEAEGAIHWDDPTLAIDWKVADSEVAVSAKDKANPLFEECERLFDYNTDYYA